MLHPMYFFAAVLPFFLFVAYKILRDQYTREQHEYYRAWVREAADIARNVDICSQSLSLGEICGNLLVKKDIESFRGIWYSFLKEDLDALVWRGIVEKAQQEVTLLCGEVTHQDVYRLTVLGVERYGHYHSLVSTSDR